MNLHEYQSKELFARFGLPVLAGKVCYTPGEAEAAADFLGSDVTVVKAQVHAGGRGKAGGVKLAKSSQEAREHAEAILGMTLVTPQTGEEGKLVRKVYVEAGCSIAKEYYLSMLVDRETRSIAIIASQEGGMEIEEVAERNPDAILTEAIDPKVGFMPFNGMSIGQRLGLDVKQCRKLTGLLTKLYDLFVAKDLAMVEINPLVLTTEGDFLILDAKCAADDSALFRHKDLQGYADYDEQDSRDVQAAKFGLSYVGLDGSIGCMVNGAGLAMATMDIIKHTGGEPANFLDVGGGATKETVTEAFKILLSDDKVKGILINIFGGIMKCDVIANGVIEAAKELGVEVPLVVRLQGTNVELGRKLLSESGLKITPADTMDDAATKIVELVKNA